MQSYLRFNSILNQKDYQCYWFPFWFDSFFQSSYFLYILLNWHVPFLLWNFLWPIYIRLLNLYKFYQKLLFLFLINLFLFGFNNSYHLLHLFFLLIFKVHSLNTVISNLTIYHFHFIQMFQYFSYNFSYPAIEPIKQ